MNFSWKSLEGQWRRQLLAYSQGSILEVGVGKIDNLKHYPMFVNVTGTDPGVRTIEKAKQAAAAHAVKADFIVSPFGELEFPDKK